MLNKKILLIMFILSFIYTQNEMILPAQKNAIKSLSQEKGFSDDDLNNYLYNEYGMNLSGLSKEQAMNIIQQFQGENPPKSSNEEPALADILEVGMSKQFYLKDGNRIRGEIMAIEDYK